MKDDNCYFMRNSWKPLIRNLPDEAAGKLFQAIAAYQDGEEPVIDDPVLNAIFQMMKETFEQDNEKYNSQIGENHEERKASLCNV